MSAINFVNYRGRARVRTSAPLPKASYQLETIDSGDDYMFSPGIETVWRVVCTEKDKAIVMFLNKFTHTQHDGGNVIYTDGRGRITAVQVLTEEELRQTREAIDEWMHQEAKA